MDCKIKILFALAITVFLIAGCAGMVMEYAPFKASDGKNGYFIKTVYGLIDGTKEQAKKEIDREANRLCPSGFTFIKEEEHPRKTKWGAENGQIDLIWEVTCNNA